MLRETLDAFELLKVCRKLPESAWKSLHGGSRKWLPVLTTRQRVFRACSSRGATSPPSPAAQDGEDLAEHIRCGLSPGRLRRPPGRQSDPQTHPHYPPPHAGHPHFPP